MSVCVHTSACQRKGVSSFCEGLGQNYSIVILCYILFLYAHSKLRTGLAGGGIAVITSGPRCVFCVYCPLRTEEHRRRGPLREGLDYFCSTAIPGYHRPSGLNSTSGGYRSKIKVSVGFESSGSLSPWLVGSCPLSGSLHGLLSVLLCV